MYKTELIRRVAKKTRYSQRAVADIMNSSISCIEDALAKGESVQIPGFGTFYTRTRAASLARHFTTGQSMQVPAMHVAAFRVGALLKRAVKDQRKKRKTAKESKS